MNDPRECRDGGAGHHPAPTDSASVIAALPTVGAIILAAGASTRMGTPKQLLQFRNRSLLRHAAEVAVASGLDPIVVVLGAYANRFIGELAGLRVQCVMNIEWKTGIGSSIRCGMQALKGCVDAVVIMLCDQPLTDSVLIRRLIATHRTTGSPIVASEYEGTRGVPALFSQAYFGELASLPDNLGAKGIIEQAGAAARGVPFPEGAINLDTPLHLEQLHALEKVRGPI